ncbi:DUF2153 family protein [Ignisphaera sp. 4213-co]|uniref:DUF2153 family protein n=1 Tax=Ignisphaera cupida TaxID=3050454 RepID=A0ABD4Z9Q4_9CREN|nr:DUF2153 family protein [Ignisphaera sp. 4213-co]MDK6029298.1 DUF2153 family protein [Ignisphaera sp. 4213-co]
MSSMYDSLTQWIEMQKKVKQWFSNVNDNAKKGDRLELILYTRMAFQHMIRTLRAFDNWLQDPFIISNMPKEELEFVWTTIYNILQQLIDLDIKHTSEFRDYIAKLEKEGKLSPLLLELFGEGIGQRRRGERERVSLSI